MCQTNLIIILIHICIIKLVLQLNCTKNCVLSAAVKISPILSQLLHLSYCNSDLGIVTRIDITQVLYLMNKQIMDNVISLWIITFPRQETVIVCHIELIQ